MIKVSFNPKNRKFIMRCPFHMNGVAKNFPSRRFDLRNKEWVLSACRKNVDELIRLKPSIDIDARALEEMGKITEKTKLPEPRPLPAEFHFKSEPMAHQAAYLDKFHFMPISAVFAEMGTGKSKMACDKAGAHYYEGSIDSMVVYCPVSVRSNWVDELRIHLPIDLGTWKYSDGAWHNSNIFVADMSESGAEKRFERFLTAPSKFKVLIVGTESLSVGDGRGKAYLAVYRFLQATRAMQCVDEGHMIKGHDSIRSNNVVELGKLSNIKMLMTGTPVLQSVLDMFMYFTYLDPQVIGIDDFYSFRNRYALLSDDGYNRVVGYDNLEELMQAVQPYVYQCLKADVLKDLPPKTYTTIEVELTPEQKKAYLDIKKNKQWASGNIEVSIKNALQKYSALQTVVAGFIRYDDLEKTAASSSTRVQRSTQPICGPHDAPKIVALVEFLKEHPHEACIIWSRYTYEINMVMEALEKAFPGKAVMFTGELSTSERDVAKADFLSGKKKYFVANQQTGGVGLTLNVADLTVYLSNSFALLDRSQSEDRNHRKGQTKNVLYVDFVAKGTVDRDILMALRDKKDLSEWVRDRLAGGESLAF